MSVYDVYGCRVSDIAAHIHRLSQILEVAWEARTSDYKGDYYRATDGRLAASFEVRSNTIPGEEEPVESAHPEVRFLLYANKVRLPDELRSALAAEGTWTLLNRTEV